MATLSWRDSEANLSTIPTPAIDDVAIVGNPASFSLFYFDGTNWELCDTSSKLDGIEEGAEVNNISDAHVADLTDNGESALHYHSSDRDRTNHTGEQPASSISDFAVSVSGNADVVTNTAKNSYPTVDADKLSGIEDNATADQTASEVDITDVNGYFTGTEVEAALQESGARSVYADSPGIIDDGVITEGTDAGTFKVGALTAYLRSTNSKTGALVQVSLAEQDNQVIPSTDTIYYVMLDYNDGSPQIVTSTTNPYADGTDYTQISIGKVMKEVDDTVHYISGGFNLQDGVQKLHQKGVELRGFELASGSVIAYQATDQFTMTTGLAYRGINSWVLPSYNSDTTQFTAIYSDGASDWTEADRNTIDVDHYDNGSGVLEDVGNNKYGVHWIFRHTDDDHIFVRYGTDSYERAEAEVAQVPSIPDHLSGFGLLIGKIIAPEGGGVFLVEMVTDRIFIGTAVSDHGALGGLDDFEDHPWATDPAYMDQSSATDGQILTWNDVSSQWEPQDAAVTYTDADAEAAINNDSDHGSTAPHNYASIPSDVGLSNVPNTNIAYSSTIPADTFTSTEVSNLSANVLADGSTPWTSNNYYDDSDAEAAVNADLDHGSTAPHDNLNSNTIDFNSEYDNGLTSANIDIDWANSGNQKITLADDISLTFSNMGVGHKQLRVIQDSTGSRALTLPSGKWPGGTVGSFSTVADAEDILSIYYDGSSYYFQITKGWS